MMHQLLRLKQVLLIIPVSRSTFLSGVKTGRFPQPVKNGRCVFWNSEDIAALVDKLTAKGGCVQKVSSTSERQEA